MHVLNSKQRNSWKSWSWSANDWWNATFWKCFDCVRNIVTIKRTCSCFEIRTWTTDIFYHCSVSDFQKTTTLLMALSVCQYWIVVWRFSTHCLFLNPNRGAKRLLLNLLIDRLRQIAQNFYLWSTLWFSFWPQFSLGYPVGKRISLFYF